MNLHHFETEMFFFLISETEMFVLPFSLTTFLFHILTNKTHKRTKNN